MADTQIRSDMSSSSGEEDEGVGGTRRGRALLSGNTCAPVEVCNKMEMKIETNMDEKEAEKCERSER